MKLKNVFEEKELEWKELEAKNKKLSGELERYVKLINQLKQYGAFIHKVFNEPFPYNEIKITHDTSSNKYEKLASQIISCFQDTKGLELSKDFLNVELMDRKVEQLEDNVLKAIDDKESLKKEISRLKDHHAKLLEQVIFRLEDTKQECEKLEELREVISKEIDDKQNKGELDINECMDYIFELAEVMGMNVNKYKQVANCIDYINTSNDVVNYLSNKEIVVNTYIEKIEKIQNSNVEMDRIFINNLITEKKKANKKKKQALMKEQKEQAELSKKQKAIERENRLVIKGRKVFPLYNIGKKNKVKYIKEPDQDEIDKEMLYYSEEDIE